MTKYNYIGLAYQFWNLVRHSIDEMEKLENRSLILSNHDPSVSEDESWEKYMEKTKWNDFNIGVPVLFNFYHGLELFMKGLLQEIGKIPNRKSHMLTDYCKTIKENEGELTHELVSLIDLYIGDENPFKEFFEENNGNVNNFYLFLRYPTSVKNDEPYRFKRIRGTDKKGLNKWLQLRYSCNALKSEIIKWKK